MSKRDKKNKEKAKSEDAADSSAQSSSPAKSSAAAGSQPDTEVDRSDKADNKAGDDAIAERFRVFESNLMAKFEQLIISRSTSSKSDSKSDSKPSKTAKKDKAIKKDTAVKEAARPARNKSSAKAALSVAMKAEKKEAELDGKQVVDLEAALGTEAEETEAADDDDSDAEPTKPPKLPSHLRVGESDDDEDEEDEEDQESDADVESTSGAADAKTSTSSPAADDLLGNLDSALAAITYDGQSAANWVARMIPAKAARGGHLHERALLLAQVFDKLHGAKPKVDSAKALLIKGLVSIWLAFEDGTYSALDSITANPMAPLSHVERLRLAKHDHNVAKYKKNASASARAGSAFSARPASSQPRAPSAQPSAAFLAKKKKGKGKPKGGAGDQ
jgi:hypothetical protein